MTRSLAFASATSFALRAALWLSVSLMMFFRKRVFGFGALVVGLEEETDEHDFQLRQKSAHLFGSSDCSP